MQQLCRRGGGGCHVDAVAERSPKSIVEDVTKAWLVINAACSLPCPLPGPQGRGRVPPSNHVGLSVASPHPAATQEPTWSHVIRTRGFPSTGKSPRDDGAVSGTSGQGPSVYFSGHTQPASANSLGQAPPEPPPPGFLSTSASQGPQGWCLFILPEEWECWQPAHRNELGIENMWTNSLGPGLGGISLSPRSPEDFSARVPLWLPLSKAPA